MGPFLSIEVCDVVTYSGVEFVYKWVSGGRGSESVSFDDELFGDFREVRCHVRDMIFGGCGVLRRSSGFCETGAYPCYRWKVTLKARPRKVFFRQRVGKHGLRTSSIFLFITHLKFAMTDQIETGEV